MLKWSKNTSVFSDGPVLQLCVPPLFKVPPVPNTQFPLIGQLTHSRVGFSYVDYHVPALATKHKIMQMFDSMTYV